MISKKNFDYLIYILECLTGVVIGLTIYKFFPVIGGWCLFSIVLVISPDRKDATSVAINRIKANVVGAAIGLILYYFSPINIAMICAGIAVGMICCELFKLQAVTRSTTVAILIITMHEPGPNFWNVALERAGGVIIGCLIGVALTFIFHLSIMRHSDKIYSMITKAGYDQH